LAYLQYFKDYFFLALSISKINCNFNRLTHLLALHKGVLVVGPLAAQWMNYK